MTILHEEKKPPIKMTAWKKVIQELIDGKRKLIFKPRRNGKTLMSHYFLNEDKTYKPCSVLEWAKQFESIDRRVAEDFFPNGYRVSTVWMGFSPHFYEGPPLVFETMVFKDGRDIYCNRCSTWNDAIKQHEIASGWVYTEYKEDNNL